MKYYFKLHERETEISLKVFDIVHGMVLERCFYALFTVKLTASKITTTAYFINLGDLICIGV